MDKLDIHGIERKLELALRNIKESNRISVRNKELILKFLDYCKAEGLSNMRVEHYARILKKIGEVFPKAFDEATKEDIIELVRKIEARKLSEWTRHDYRTTLKKFFKWLRGSDSYPEEVKWLKVKTPKSNNIIPTEILSEQDIKKLIRVADNPRDKAFVSVLFESGCRIGELLNLRLKNVQFEDSYVRLIVEGKTGRRMVPLIFSSPMLVEWINNHPLRHNPESPLWPKKTKINEPMNYALARKLLQTLARKAKIKKRVNPHSFRHARATILSKRLSEAILNEIFGWVQGSRMPAVYIHLSGRDTIQPLLELYGLKKAEEKETILKPKKCWKCGSLNEPTAEICISCQAILDIRKALEMEKGRRREIKELKTQLQQLTKKLASLENLVNTLISRPSLQIEKEAPSASERLVNILPTKYQVGA